MTPPPAPTSQDYPARFQRLAPLLQPLARVYALAMAARRQAYAAGLMPAVHPGAPCVSVGNIAVGGSGKTPLVLWLLRWAKERGLRACVLTRGYGGRSALRPLPVRADTPWQASGDEPLLLARAHPEALVLADPKRRRAAAYLAALAPDQRPELCVMDDGMQHLPLRRDLNLVLLRPQDLAAAWGRVLPGGLWREPASALAAADAFCIKCAPGEFAGVRPLVERRLAGFGKPVFTFGLQPTGLREAWGAPVQPPAGPYLLFSAVADNVRVAATATELMGQPPAAQLPLGDHRALRPVDHRRLDALAREHGATCILCTAKDAVKLPPTLAWPLPIFILEVSLHWEEHLFTSQPFPQWWHERFAAVQSDPSFSTTRSTHGPQT